VTLRAELQLLVFGEHEVGWQESNRRVLASAARWYPRQTPVSGGTADVLDRDTEDVRRTTVGVDEVAGIHTGPLGGPA
jgi:hypothetical protein